MKNETIILRIPCRVCYRLVVASEYTIPRPTCADCAKGRS